MRIEKPATGFQILFLVIAFNVFMAIGCKYLAQAIGWPDEFFNTLGNLVGFSLALVILFGIAPVRRHLLDQLSVGFAPSARVETFLVAMGKVAIPFAVVGVGALLALYVTKPNDVLGSAGTLASRDAMDRRYFSPIGLLNAAIAVSLGPLVEELVFRGLLYRAWERQWGWIPAMLLTSIAFGAIHPGTFWGKFFASVALVCLLRRTGTLWAPILCHVLYNVLVTWPLLGHVLLVKSPATAGHIETWWPNLACLAFVAIALPAYVWLARKPPRDRHVRSALS